VEAILSGMRNQLFLLAPLALAACATAAPPPSSGSGSAGFGQTARAGPVRITPLTLIEDSRCPQGVQCVWAGQVRISARIAGRGGIRTRELVLGKPVAVGSGMLVLETVAPPRHRPGVAIARSAYRFGFRYTANTMTL
jgi:hypothetical protein